MGIKCCKDCVPPKRQSDCHTKCPQYLTEKKLHDKQTNDIRKQKQAEINYYEQKIRGVMKALKHRKKGKTNGRFN